MFRQCNVRNALERKHVAFVLPNTATWHQNTIWNPISQVIMEKSMLNESMNAMNMKTLEPTCGYLVIGMVCIVCLIAFLLHVPVQCEMVLHLITNQNTLNSSQHTQASIRLNKLRISSDFQLIEFRRLQISGNCCSQITPSSNVSE